MRKILRADYKKIISKWYKKLAFLKQFDDNFYLELEKLSAERMEKVINAKDYVEYITGGDDRILELMFSLYMCEKAKRRYKKLGISEEILLATLQDIRLWAEFYYRDKGKLGIKDFWWINHILTANIFRIERFEFEIAELEENNDFNLPKGKAVFTHIPSGEKLTEESIKKSFNAGQNFLKDKFNEENLPFVCSSWLLWNELPEILGSDSNIVKFQELFEITKSEEALDVVKFVFGKIDMKESIDNFVPKSTLQKALLRFKKSRKSFKLGKGSLKRI